MAERPHAARKKSAGQKIRLVLIVIFSATFVVSAYMLISRLVQYGKGSETYQEAEQLAVVSSVSRASRAPAAASVPAVSEAASSEEEPVSSAAEKQPDPSQISLSAVRQYNSDIIGWIEIPGSVVSYPLMQTSDNDYYLTHTWKRQELSVGSIFLDCACKPDLSDFNSIIYGHNMYNGSMFASIYNYRSKSYWESHPNIYLTTDSGLSRYAVCAAYQVNVQDPVYQFSFPDTASKQSFLSFAMRHRFYETGEVPETSDRIITLSTCIGSDDSVRWVVQAVLRETL
jgi:sortase B